MTHEELLARADDLNMWVSLGQVHKDDVYAMARIVRSVINLHKLRFKGGGGKHAKYCAECGFPYPCPTIQAIEKELK